MCSEPTIRARHRSSARRGSGYIAVLGTSVLIAVIGTSALITAQVQQRASSRSNDLEEARHYAQSAIALARLTMATDANWRSNRPSGVWIEKQVIGTGTLSVECVIPTGGNLATWESEPVVVTGIGEKGPARHLTQVTLAPVKTGLSSLGVAITAGGSIAFNGGTLTASAAMTSNVAVTATSSSVIDADVETVGSITGGRYFGSRISGAAPREMPSSTVFDAYIANGTPISYASTSGNIDRVLLTPTRNPFGSQTNPLGIYVIDCANQKLEIKKSRILGTLVILNPRSDSQFVDGVVMEPAVANFPVLLIRGPMNFALRDTIVKESEAGNLNPPGVPFDGVTDIDTADNYPSEIHGLIYQSGNFVNSERFMLYGGLIVGGTVTNSRTMFIQHGGEYLTDPPPGFSSKIVMQPRLGSWKQVVR